MVAGSYNGLQVAIKVLHSTVDTQVLQELSREVGSVFYSLCCCLLLLPLPLLHATQQRSAFRLILNEQRTG